MSPFKKLISISIPVFNEHENLSSLYERLVNVAKVLQDRYDFEFVFTDNNSTDATWQKLCSLSADDPRIRALRFASNIGYQRSLLANYAITRGDAVLQLDADLQDPPELLFEFIPLWEKGIHDVVGVRIDRPEGRAINAFRKLGYWFLNLVSESRMTRNAGDFRLLDRRVVDVLKASTTPNPYIRGMISSFGFRQTQVPYKRAARLAGKSNFGIRRILNLGIQGLLNHSTLPLRFATVLGVSTLFLAIISGVALAIQKILHPDTVAGWTSLAVLIWFGIGLISFLLGIIGEYIFRIYLILRQPTVTPVADVINC